MLVDGQFQDLLLELLLACLHTHNHHHVPVVRTIPTLLVGSLSWLALIPDVGWRSESDADATCSLLLVPNYSPLSEYLTS